MYSLRKVENMAKLAAPYGLVMLEREYKKYKNKLSLQNFLYFYYHLMTIPRHLIIEKTIKKDNNIIIYTFQELLSQATNNYGTENITYICVDRERERESNQKPCKKYVFCDPQKYSPYGFSSITYKLWEQGISFPIYITSDIMCNNLYGNVDPNFVINNADSFLKIYKKLADKPSKNLFLSICRTILGHKGYMGFSSYSQYNHPKVRANSNDVVIEGGVLDGRTSIELSRQVEKTGKVIAFEPVHKFYIESQKNCEKYPNIELINLGLWSCKHQFSIQIPEGEAKGGASIVNNIGGTNELCHTISIDEFWEDKTYPCNLIKLDIEGAEYPTILGAHNTISRYHPKLQISLYHTLEDYVRIPLLIMEKYPWYKLYLGHHTLFNDETVLYCV